LAELVGTDRALIVRRVSEALSKKTTGGTRATVIDNPYGDGKAAARIVDWMLETWS
jgi:UDP-N-acetylglucosamine 2-epimerase